MVRERRSEPDGAIAPATMRADGVVIDLECFEKMRQMLVAEGDEVIEALALDRADERTDVASSIAVTPFIHSSQCPVA